MMSPTFCGQVMKTINSSYETRFVGDPERFLLSKLDLPGLPRPWSVRCACARKSSTSGGASNDGQISSGLLWILKELGLIKKV